MSEIKKVKLKKLKPANSIKELFNEAGAIKSAYLGTNMLRVRKFNNIIQDVKEQFEKIEQKITKMQRKHNKDINELKEKINSLETIATKRKKAVKPVTKKHNESAIDMFTRIWNKTKIKTK